MASRGRDNNEVFKSSIEKNLSALCGTHNLYRKLHILAKVSFFHPNISDCVKSLKTNFDDTQFPIDDDNIMLHRLGDRLEFLLHVGLRRML